MKILLIHTVYRFRGGEDSVVEAERNLLLENGDEVFSLFFENPTNPVKAAWIFLLSVFNPFSYLKVIKAVRKFQPDVIHVHNWHFAASPAIFTAARAKRIPTVHTLHNYRLLCPSGILFDNGELFLESLRQNFPWAAVKRRVYRNSLFQTFWLALAVWIHKKTGTWAKIDGYIALTSFGKELIAASSLNIPADRIFVKPNFT